MTGSPAISRPFGWLLAVILLVVLADAGAYWIADSLVNPRASAWERVMFRPGGDVTYLPFVRALAEGNLGEPADYASRGEGSWNIPWLLLTPWALGLKLFGPWGFLLMDLALQVLRWWLIAGILHQIGLVRERSWLWGCLISIAMFLPVNPVIVGLDRGALEFDRITRPLVTDPVFLGQIWLLLVALLRPVGKIAVWPLAGAALLTGLAPHGDFHAFFYCGPLFGVAWLWLAWRERGNWRAAWWRLALSCLPLLALLAYGAYLMSGTPHEIRVRLGVFPLPITRFPLPTEFYIPQANAFWLIGMGLLLGGWVWGRESLRRPENRGPRLVLVGALIGMGLIYLAPWVCILVTGEMVQTMQFGQRVAFAGYYVTAFGLCALALAVPPWPRWNARVLAWAPPLLSAAVLGWVLRDGFNAARDPRHPWQEFKPLSELKTYRRDFRELERTLAARGYTDSAEVLATTDIAVYSWWITALNQGTYLVDPFGSALPDREVEDRLLRVLNVCGARDSSILYQHSVLVFFHSCYKYQFSPAWSFIPREQLGPRALEALVQIPFSAAYSIVPPLPEVERIEKRRQELLAAEGPEGGPQFPVSLIILNTANDLPGAETGAFEKVFENASFRVYAKRAPGGGVPANAPLP